GRRLELADAEDRQRDDDRADADHGDADGEQQPELAEHRHLGEPQGGKREDRVEGHDQQRRAQVPRGLLDRMVGPPDEDLLFDAFASFICSASFFAATAAAPSSSIDWLPFSRTMTCACRSSGMNERNARRIWPWLS